MNPATARRWLAAAVPLAVALLARRPAYMLERPF
jgi:hypothetical protein